MFLKECLCYVYPNVCGICRKKIKSNRYTCENCLSILKCYRERIIKGNNNSYDYMINLYEYKGIIKNQIWYLKFRNEKFIGKTFAELIIYKLQQLNIDFDVIIPVPISKSRFLERGYNQCEEITNYISKVMNKKTFSNLLVKVKNNKRQSELHIDDRKNNVMGVYKLKSKEKIKGKKILLIDDVCTTGATLNECSKMLRNAGVKEIIVVTIAYVK